MEQRVNLHTLGNGLAAQKFQDEFEKVLENIADRRTKGTAKREIKLTFVVVPDEGREVGVVEVKSECKLAPIPAKKTMMYFTNDNEGPVATTSDPKQMELADQIKAKVEGK